MTNENKAELLDWLLEQDELKLRRVGFMGGKVVTYVWLDGEHEDTPSGSGPTTLEALQAAKDAQERDDER